MRLYKFMPFQPELDTKSLQFSYISSLLTMNLYSPKPETFNDPWDAPIFFESADDCYLKKTLGQEAFSQGYFENGVTSRTIKAIKSHSNFDLIVKRCFPLASSARFCFDLASHIGISCLTKKWSEPLMWAHYSRGHNGICFGLDFIRPDNQRFLISDVIYAKNPPSRIPFTNDIKNSDIFQRQISDQLVTKSSHWEYEDEVRILNPQVEYIAAKPYYSEFDIGEPVKGNYRIVEVILGSRIDNLVQALAPIKFSICGAATAIINRNACNGTRMKQDDADRLIENVLLGIEIYKINGIDDKYALIREKINFPEDLLKRPLLPLPW